MQGVGGEITKRTSTVPEEASPLRENQRRQCGSDGNRFTPHTTHINSVVSSSFMRAGNSSAARCRIE